MVPQAAAESSTPPEDNNTPVAWSDVRAAFRFRRAPVGQVSPFQSVDVAAPSTPMKFGRLMAALAVTARARRLRKRHGEGRQRDAAGVRIGGDQRVERLQLDVQWDVGIRQHHAPERDRPSQIGSRETGACARSACFAPWLPSYSETGLGPSSRRQTAGCPSSCANSARNGPTES